MYFDLAAGSLEKGAHGPGALEILESQKPTKEAPAIIPELVVVGSGQIASGTEIEFPQLALAS